MEWIKQSKWNGILQILIMRWVLLLLYLWMKIMFLMSIHAFMAGCWCLPINKRFIKWALLRQHRTASTLTHEMNENERNWTELLTRSSLLADRIQIAIKLGILWSEVPLSYRTLQAFAFGLAHNKRPDQTLHCPHSSLIMNNSIVDVSENELPHRLTLCYYSTSTSYLMIISIQLFFIKIKFLIIPRRWRWRWKRKTAELSEMLNSNNWSWFCWTCGWRGGGVGDGKWIRKKKCIFRSCKLVSHIRKEMRR